MLWEGSDTPKILFISDYQRVHCKAEGRVFSEYLGAPLTNAIKRAGIRLEEYAMCCLASSDAGSNSTPRTYGPDDLASLQHWLSSHPTVTTLVPLGEHALETVTGLKGIGKWHCSVVQATAVLGGRKCIPLFHPDYIARVYSDHFYLNVGCHKLRKECETATLNIPERKFLLNPPLEETLDYLNDRVARAELVAIDWEFGRGQLNCLGFATSAREAIAIKCLPHEYSPDNYYRLFQAVKRIAEGSVKKICQHAIVETSWLARYGIGFQGLHWDTMWAQKFLYPEFDKGLDNVGRLFTPYPYWKDDNDDWSNIRDWNQHLQYNAKDTTGTYAAYEAQVAALQARGLTSTFNWVMQFAPVIQEMCTEGLRVDPGALKAAREGVVRQQENFQKIIDEECLAALGKMINVRSPKQLKAALEAMGMKLPTKRGKGDDGVKTTTDKKALVKLKRRYPEASILPALVGISAANKRISSYIDFNYDQRTSRVHYTLDGCGTETGRWAGYQSSWGEGFNPQTVPKSVRSCFIPDQDKVLVQIDLKQAESRYVAWEAPDVKLMELLTSGDDIHKYVASKIYNKPQEIINDFERQLGKKAGHASNYGTGPRTFAETCLVEMNYYMEEKEARNVLDSYFIAFPGIRRRQENIKREIYNKRMLRTPLGRVRHFYGRMDDSTFREAYAYSPQSVIPDITNYLMLALWRDRDYLGLGWDEGGRFLLQVHDSLLLQANPERVPDIAAYTRSLDWHPKIELAGGTLKIPVDVEFGYNWKKLEKI